MTGCSSRRKYRHEHPVVETHHRGCKTTSNGGSSPGQRPRKSNANDAGSLFDASADDELMVHT
jgi:hypothetical protein